MKNGLGANIEVMPMATGKGQNVAKDMKASMKGFKASDLTRGYSKDEDPDYRGMIPGYMPEM